MEAKELRIGNLIEINAPVMNKIIAVDVYHISELKRNNGFFKPISLTEEWVLKFEQFDKTDKEGTPCFFNGDNIILFDRGGCFDAYLHSEVNGDIFFATRLFYVHQLQNFYHAIERQELTIKE